MNTKDLYNVLNRVVTGRISHSVMIWGPPGIGKSSIVSQIAQASGLSFIDVRLSQLAPTDLRGLPVPENGISRWYPPEFLPREGKGVLFLDELNMAPPAIQGIAQQLILDRRVGSYAVPDGWYIWAAGNRKEDRASVFDMPAPLANRFIHLAVEADLDTFAEYAINRKLNEMIVPFLKWKPALLHSFQNDSAAWPSPRSWEMASSLMGAGISPEYAVGEGAGAEFSAFCEMHKTLISLDAVLQGNGERLQFPEDDEPSKQYAVAVGLGIRASGPEQGVAAFKWVAEKAAKEWLALFINTLQSNLNTRKGEFRKFCELLKAIPNIDTAIWAEISRAKQG